MFLLQQVKDLSVFSVPFKACPQLNDIYQSYSKCNEAASRFLAAELVVFHSGDSGLQQLS